MASFIIRAPGSPELRHNVELEVSEPLLCPHCVKQPQLRRTHWSSAFACFIALLLLVGLISSGSWVSRRTDRTFWRSREFETVKSDIPSEYKQVQFRANLLYNESHQLYRPIPVPDYVGPPSAETDAAWENMLGAVNVFVSPEESQYLDGSLWQDPETGLYMAQVTLFHDLHCINMIRKALYLNHYPELKDYTIQAHIEHCIDAVRESLMCTGDMTLLPVRWSKNRDWIKPDFATVHTCRDYEKLRQWSLARDAADPATYPSNAERLRSEWGLEKWNQGSKPN